MAALLITDMGEVFEAAAGRRFDPVAGRWIDEAAALHGQPLSAVAAVRHLVQKRGARRLPIAVIGPTEASAKELAFAEEAGRGIAGLGLPLVCGGRGGCMEAASQAAASAGGLVIGILPSDDWRTANAHVSVPIASGLGEARNAIIASACFALIAVGGGHGTLSEMALGLKMERLVIALPPAARVKGSFGCASVDEAIAAVSERYLGLGT